MTLPSSGRFGTFFSRVETERTVLSIINHPGNTGPELHGLTAAAIDRWAVEVDTLAPRDTALVAEVVRLLQRISIRGGAHADQSRVVFADEVHASLPVHDLVMQLRAVYDRWNARTAT